MDPLFSRNKEGQEIQKQEKQMLNRVFESFDKAFDRKVKVWQINEILNTNYDMRRIDFMALKKRKK